MFSEKKDHIETYIKKVDESLIKDENISFLAKLLLRLNKIKQKLLNDLIEETKNERCELKDFNRNFESKKAEANYTARTFMFNR